MIYRSNLIAPDLAPRFNLLSKPRGFSFDHDVPSDPEYDPECGYWTHDEAAILYTVAFIVGGQWLDIGCRFGWTSAHIAAAGASVLCVDPILRFAGPQLRFEQNMEPWWSKLTGSTYLTAGEFFERDEDAFDGFVIDGCHDEPEPLNDAKGCVDHAKPNCVILFHDFYGKPIQDAVTWLMKKQGFRCRIYWTPNGIALCWRWREPGRFTPPAHQYDPIIRATVLQHRAHRLPGFDLRATE